MSHRYDVTSLAILGLLFAPLAVAGGQQTCLTVTPTARADITSFLQDPAESTWLQAHSISATTADQLTPLTDAVDAGLCRKMDSTLAISPAYYLRAGSYVIATVLQPMDAVPGRITRGDLGHTLFVFDSTGRWIHSPGENAPIAPPDFRPTTAMAGNVELRWTNRDAAVTSYRVQRATGSGAYSTLVTVAGNATSYLDASATGGTAYRYQLVAVNAAGGTGLSNEVTVTVADPGPVTRPTTGLLYRDDFNRADGPPGADWVSETGLWTIASNELQINIGYFADGVVRLAGLPVRKDFHIQVMSSRSQLGNYAAVYARRVGGTLYLADLGSSSEQGGKPRMYRQTNGAYTVLGYGTFQSTANTKHRLTFSVLGGERSSWSNGALQVSVTDATPANDIAGSLSLNAYGSGAAGTVRFDDLIINSSRSVTIAGLPAAHRLRVAGLLSPRSTNGAAVAVDLLGTQLPADRIEILDANDVMVKIFTPADGVWGGDRYSLNGAP